MGWVGGKQIKYQSRIRKFPCNGTRRQRPRHCQYNVQHIMFHCRCITVRGEFMYVLYDVYIYIYIYKIKWTVFVNVTTKSAQHAHARMIAIIVEKSPNSSHMYDHVFMDNTNRQAVCKSTVMIYRLPDDWYYPWNHGRTYDLSLDFFQQLYIYIYSGSMGTWEQSYDFRSAIEITAGTMGKIVRYLGPLLLTWINFHPACISACIRF